MGAYTRIEQQIHIIIPYFIILTLFVNNTPIDLNFAPFDFNTSDFLKNMAPVLIGYFPKPRFKNIILIISFLVFLILFESKPFSDIWIYSISLVLIIVPSYGIWAIYNFIIKKENIHNGVVKGEGNINDINLDTLPTAIANSVTSIFCIFLIFMAVHATHETKCIPTLGSIVVIIGLICLYLKADGILGLINGIWIGLKTYGTRWYETYIKHGTTNTGIVSWFWSFLSVFIFISFGYVYFTQEKNSSILKKLNPYIQLAIDTKHWVLIFIILLLLTNIFSSKYFIILTIIICIFELIHNHDKPILTQQ